MKGSSASVPQWPRSRGGSSDRAFDHAWGLLEKSVRTVAWRLTRNREDQEELVQEARIELWLIDPTRFRLDDARQLRYLRKMVMHRMWRMAMQVKLEPEFVSSSREVLERVSA